MVLFMRFSLLLVVNIISLFQSALQDGSPVPRPWSQTLLEPWLTFQILLSVVLLIAANEKLKCKSKFTVLVLLFCIICLFLNFIKFIKFIVSLCLRYWDSIVILSTYGTLHYSYFCINCMNGFWVDTGLSH